MKFNLGDRISVKGHWNFPNDCKGFIFEPPEDVVELALDQEPWEGIHRIVKGENGSIEFFWVRFDDPQIDGDGDGPYPEGEVDAKFIALIQ